MEANDVKHAFRSQRGDYLTGETMEQERMLLD